jgi:CheY-like chemotaxis protein
VPTTILRRDPWHSPVPGPEMPSGGSRYDENFWEPPPSFFAQAGNSETVLVVDDDRDLLAATTLRLQRAGYVTRCAYDGDEVVDSARKVNPDAIVLDIRMPRMDGLTALKLLRSLPETMHIPVVVLSSSLVDQQSALDAGARCFLRKPHNGTLLVNAVERAIHETN